MKLLAFFISFFIIQVITAQQVDFTHIDFQKFYRVGNSDEVFLPLGDISFVDKVTYFKEGNPKVSKRY